MIRILIIFLIVLTSITASSQSNKESMELNTHLDTTPYWSLQIPYGNPYVISDSIKMKMIDALEGNLKQEVIVKLVKVADFKLDRIKHETAIVCELDSNKIFDVVYDSLIEQENSRQIQIYKKAYLPSRELILAIGNWNIQDGKEIMKSYLNEDRYKPIRFYLLLSLAKMNDQKSLNEITEISTLKYWMNKVPLDTINNNTTYDNLAIIYNAINNIYFTGKYLKSRTILLNIPDFISIKGNERVELSGEPTFYMPFTYGLFSHSLISLFNDNQNYNEWYDICKTYINSYEQLTFNEKRITKANENNCKVMISDSGLNEIKNRLKYWILNNY